jgi:hypothetical protein
MVFQCPYALFLSLLCYPPLWGKVTAKTSVFTAKKRQVAPPIMCLPGGDWGFGIGNLKLGIGYLILGIRDQSIGRSGIGEGGEILRASGQVGDCDQFWGWLCKVIGQLGD